MATSNSPEEKAVSISKTDGESILFDLWNLEHILYSSELINKRITVIAVTGDHQSGKSFFLNYILRYLRANGEFGWIGEPEEPLVGFDWSRRGEHVTKGIWAWNKLIHVDMHERGEVYLMLIDTQMFHFILRDWDREDVYTFGTEGAKEYFNHTYPEGETDGLFNRFQEFYTHRGSNLLPRSATNRLGLKNSDGRNSQLGEEFMKHYMDAISWRMSFTYPIQRKRVMDMELTCGDLYKYCECFNQFVEERDRIENMSILEADMLYATNRKLEAHTEYYKLAKEECLEHNLSSLEELDICHAKYRDMSVKQLDDIPIATEMLHSDECDWLMERLDFLYIFIHKDGEDTISKMARVHDMKLTDEVFMEFEKQVRQNRKPTHSHLEIINLLRQARDELLQKLGDGLTRTGGIFEMLYSTG